MLLRCHVEQCGVDEIVGAVGLDLSELFPPRPFEAGAPRKSLGKPFRTSDVVKALKHELATAFVILGDVGHGRPHQEADRPRALEAQERISRFMGELDSAY